MLLVVSQLSRPSFLVRLFGSSRKTNLPIRPWTKIWTGKFQVERSITNILSQQTACRKHLISESLLAPSSHRLQALLRNLFYHLWKSQGGGLVASAKEDPKSCDDGDGPSTSAVDSFLQGLRTIVCIVTLPFVAQPLIRLPSCYLPFHLVSRYTASSFRLSTGLIFITAGVSTVPVVLHFLLSLNWETIVNCFLNP